VQTDVIDNHWTNRSFDYSKKYAEDRAHFMMVAVIVFLIMSAALIYLLIRLRQALSVVKRHNLSLLDEVHYDPLTSIYNRRFLEENMSRIIKSLSRSGGILSLMMIDVDFFKKYNDTYGHSMGDDCLKAIAEILTQCVNRGNDFVARYGGEEFVVVLPNTDENGARKVADKLLERVRERNIPHGKSDVADCITISIGATTGQVEHTQKADDYFKWADEALYLSKQGGRNRLSFIGA
jgi:diguanylate cyclase (GGDEF)-like protein